MYRKDAASPEFLFAKDPQAGRAAVLSCVSYSLNAFSSGLQNEFMLWGLTCGVFESTIDSITEPVEEDVL
jgi:hypothetical protein